MDNNLPPGVTPGMIDKLFPESLAQNASPAMMHDWIDGLEHNSYEFKNFIDFCYGHFRKQMEVLEEAYCNSEGERAFEEYLSQQKDTEPDRE